MGKVIKIKKGLDILIKGEASGFISSAPLANTFAIKPSDFNGLLPKLEVAVGDEVKAGDPLFHDKSNPSIKFTAPVSGEIVAINRGEKRVIQEIVILADKKNSFKNFGTTPLNALSEEAVKEKMLLSGAWVHLKQRPFNIIADPNVKPKAIFISGFNTAPLSADINLQLANKSDIFQIGIDILNKLANGNVFIGLPADKPLIDTLKNCKNTTNSFFDGPHPSGLVGVQIHFTRPINKGDYVFTIAPQDVLIIGKLFKEGIYDTKKLVALVGSSFKTNAYIETYVGTSIGDIIKTNLNEGKNRIISGNILCGTQIKEDNYLGFYDDTLTIIPEGDEAEFLGWLLPTYPRPSASRAFVWLSRLFQKGKESGFEVNANMHGEERAYVVTNEYEKVMPMDILPNYLIKAIMANDIDKMEQLGIYEVVEEDLALCEFVCTSKIDVQSILRKGLNYALKEA